MLKKKKKSKSRISSERGLLAETAAKHLATDRLLLTFETTAQTLATCDKTHPLIHLNTSNTPLTDQLNKMDHLPTCWRHQLSKLWLECLNRDILNNYGISCLQAPEKQGDSL